MYAQTWSYRHVRLTLTKLSSMSWSLFGCSLCIITFCGYVHFHASIERRRLRQVMSGHLTNGPPTILCFWHHSYWLEERNWSNCILCRKKGETTTQFKWCGLGLLVKHIRTYEARLNCNLAPKFVAIWHWLQPITTQQRKQYIVHTTSYGAVAFTTYRVFQVVVLCSERPALLYISSIYDTYVSPTVYSPAQPPQPFVPCYYCAIYGHLILDVIRLPRPLSVLHCNRVSALLTLTGWQSDFWKHACLCFLAYARNTVHIHLSSFKYLLCCTPYVRFVSVKQTHPSAGHL